MVKCSYRPHWQEIQSHFFWKSQYSLWEHFHWQQWGEASGGCKHEGKNKNRSVTSKKGNSTQHKTEFINWFRFLRYEFLSLKHSVLLQHLKVIFLIWRVLVNHEDVRVEFGDDEAQVKLADDLHLFEHVFTVGMKERELGVVEITLQYWQIQSAADRGVRSYLISFLSSSSALWFSPGLILALKRR